LGVEPCALAFFGDAGIDSPIAAAPTRVRPDKPPKYPTTRYREYMIDYQQRTYKVFGSADKDAVQ
jgi:hypothetical protein